MWNRIDMSLVNADVLNFGDDDMEQEPLTPLESTGIEVIFYSAHGFAVYYRLY